jgi:2-oxoglutarate dehydrogenase E1 component
VLRRNYCGKVGLEYMHIPTWRSAFLQERMEGKDKDHQLHARGQEGDPAR